ncbi:TetR family transcriptional regulator [Arthrobacter gandavensis]|uniref:TetR family transcriptional regulator n=1 Tax=Arthrobacter gandavensis TaxID=169960 RepID=A0ABN2PAI1_9MICC|nr:TetR family transcriptional regulator [Arthrobacter citreus]
MQVKEPSFTGSARRAQIVDATLSVIAEQGYDRASYARIAEQARLSSTRLISYHFAGKADLISACAAQVIERIGAWTGSAVHAEETAAGALQAYITATIRFIDDNRAAMTALTRIVLAGALKYTTADDAAAAAPLEDLLRRGQESGEFRSFDPAVMAHAVQRSIDGLPFVLERAPETDCAAYGRELGALFELATRLDARKPVSN